MNLFTRRHFLQLAAGTLGAAAFPHIKGCSSKNDAPLPIGVQLYSVRHELARDFRGTIARIADMGFEGVEFADYFGMSANEIRSVLDEFGLRSCGTHVVLDVLREDQFEETVAFNKRLGNEFFILRWIPEYERDSLQTFLQTIEEYNEITERLATHNMRLGYHNHNYIFERFGNSYLWDILAENTDPRFVMQLDTGHAASLGLDPVELLRRHPGRTTTLHAKAYSSTRPEAVLGEDELDWKAIIEAARNVGGVEWFILEYEIDGVPPLQALEQSIHNARQLI